MHPYLIKIPLPWGGAFPIASYGFMIMLGFLLSLFIARKRARRLGVEPDVMFDLCVSALLGGIIGARLFYVIYDWPAFRDNPIEIFRMDKGGLIFYGGVMGGLGVLIVLLIVKRLPLLRTMDVIASVVPLGHAFGRIGCFLYGCCFGRVTSSWLGVRFPRILEPGNVRDAIYNVGDKHIVGSLPFVQQLQLPEGLLNRTAEWSLPVHPTQLYEAGYNLIIFGVLSFWFLRRWREGEVGWLYLALYGTARFSNEFLRADQTAVLWGLKVAQLMCVPMVIAGLTMLVRGRMLPRQPLPEPWRPLRSENTGRGRH